MNNILSFDQYIWGIISSSLNVSNLFKNFPWSQHKIERTNHKNFFKIKVKQPTCVPGMLETCERWHFWAFPVVLQCSIPSLNTTFLSPYFQERLSNVLCSDDHVSSAAKSLWNKSKTIWQKSYITIWIEQWKARSFQKIYFRRLEEVLEMWEWITHQWVPPEMGISLRGIKTNAEMRESVGIEAIGVLNKLILSQGNHH